MAISKTKRKRKGRTSSQKIPTGKVLKRPEGLDPKLPVCMAIDGDIVAYHVTTSLLTETRATSPNGEAYYTYQVDEAQLFAGFEERVLGLAAWMHAKEVHVCFSGGSNFRKRVLRTYKHNRVAKKPLGYWGLVSWAMSHPEWAAVKIPTLEADDAMGVIATDPARTAKQQVVLVSDDKDMLTIPTRHLRLKPSKDADKQGVFTVDPVTALRNFYGQVLTGDPGDGYYGLKGVGKVTAEKLLANCESESEFWKVVKNRYREAGRLKDALVNARMARILTHELYCEKKGALLWQPPK